MEHLGSRGIVSSMLLLFTQAWDQASNLDRLIRTDLERLWQNLFRKRSRNTLTQPEGTRSRSSTNSWYMNWGLDSGSVT